MEDWLTPREGQCSCGFFSEGEKQESTWMVSLAPEEAITNNPYRKGDIFRQTMLVEKWSEVGEGYGDDINPPLCGILYN